jgi:RNA polymerase sigma-70 factor (ECF subfamily)
MSCDQAIDKNQLVMLCKAGDREAQGQLYATYRRKMMKVIRQYVADYDMAQDVLHDGFIIILSQIQNLRNSETLEYWMATIMKNLSLHCLSQIQFDDILKEPEYETDAEDEYGLSYDDLLALIEQLPNGYRTVFRLAVLEGKSHQEIAEMLGISPHSSASQLARAKEKLRHLIIEHKQKAGLLTLLVLLVCGTYLFYRNTLLNGDLQNDFMAAKDAANQMPSNSNEDISIDIIGKPTIASVQLINKSNALVPVISSKITESIMSSNDSISTPNDTIKSICDTTIIVTTTPTVKQELIAEVGFAPVSHSTVDTWKIRIATNALGLSIDGNSGDAASSPMSDPSTGGVDYQEAELTTSVHHLMPITFGVRFSKEISLSWSVESGLQYNLLRSEITNTSGNGSYVQNVRANYLSIPLAMSYNVMQINRINMYVSGGISLDIPVGASLSSDVNNETQSLKYPISVSPRIGLGLEYKITSSSMLFVQPTLNYHIMKESKYPILWQDKPITLELPIGIRISW